MHFSIVPLKDVPCNTDSSAANPGFVNIFAVFSSDDCALDCHVWKKK